MIRDTMIGKLQTQIEELLDNGRWSNEKRSTIGLSPIVKCYWCSSKDHEDEIEASCSPAEMYCTELNIHNTCEGDMGRLHGSIEELLILLLVRILIIPHKCYKDQNNVFDPEAKDSRTNLREEGGMIRVAQSNSKAIIEMGLSKHGQITEDVRRCRRRVGSPATGFPDSRLVGAIYISSLALLKMLKHGRAGVPMEVMGLMLGEFVDEYTVRVVDVFAMPQSGTGVSVEAVMFFNQICLTCLNKQEGQRWWWVGTIHILDLAVGFLV
ncbi:hypothetical protein J1N35_013996 [Gossypium stocksii]|uniref:MPN domain-containing protein n=1 Tax=Gossypium stocksii TaxID=47602 RepID=A0A9D3VTD7_9ROSI|nr:hypothetical protein J1N35_013996 [Gossypium stocksii]